MGSLLHVCLFNTDAEATDGLVEPIQALNFVRLDAAVGTAEELAAAIQAHKINLIIFHLDPAAGPVVEVIEQVSTRHPDIGMIAVSARTAPEAILAPMRAGCDQFVCKPIDPVDLATAVSRVASKRLLAQPRSRCLCVTGASGGAGATTVACNLALEIGQLTDRTCALVDLDLQFGDVAVNFDSDPKFTLYDLASTGGDLDGAILSSTLVTLPCHVAILARPEMLEHQDEVTPDAVRRILDALRARFENVIVDVPRFVTHSAAAAFNEADGVFVVCQLLVPSLRNTKRFCDMLLRMGVPEDRIHVIVNRMDGRKGRVTVKDVEDTVKRPVFGCIPSDFQFVARSIDVGQPIASIDRSSPVRSAIRKIAKQITTDAGPDAEAGAARRGLLGRLFTH